MQDDLSDTMEKIINEIKENEQNVEINLKYVFLDRDNEAESYESCELFYSYIYSLPMIQTYIIVVFYVFASNGKLKTLMSMFI